MRSRRPYIATFAIVSLLASAVRAQQQAPAPAVDEVLEKWTKDGRVTGAVVLVMQDGVLVYDKAVGFADRENKVPMRRDTVFRLASMSKAYVSATALAMVDEGKLSVDDPVTKYLPYFTPKLPDGTTPEIKVRHLLTHTSGLNYGFQEAKDGPYHKLNVLDGLEDPRGATLEENLRRLAQAPLLFKPGTQWNYSLSIDVLGAVIEKANCSTLPDAVARYVTGPLGLKDTGFAATDKTRLATPYAPGTPAVLMKEDEVDNFGPGGLHFTPGRNLDPKAYPSGGAGMVGTALDYISFLEAVRTHGQPILSPASANAMTHPQCDGVPAGPGFEYGFGFDVSTDFTYSHMRKGSYRWGGVYGGNYWVDPRARVTTVALTNTAITGTSGPFVEELAREIAKQWVLPTTK